MIKPLQTCLWFDGKAQEAATFTVQFSRIQVSYMIQEWL